MEKIQELTEKIRREGVEKGQAEAAQIVAQAKEQAAKIVADAKAQAEAIAAKAKKDATELEQNTKSELKLYTAQALNALKSEIANVLTNSTVSTEVEKLTADKDFLGKFAVTLAEKWQGDAPAVISAKDAEGLKAFFMKNAKALLDKGLKIEKVNGQDVLFVIQPADGSYKVQFGKEEFEAYFKTFLRPQLVEMLF
jgi:V/A-type H+-transporting ATPase subunit E